MIQTGEWGFEMGGHKKKTPSRCNSTWPMTGTTPRRSSPSSYLCDGRREEDKWQSAANIWTRPRELDVGEESERRNFLLFFSSSSTLGPFVPRRVAHWLLRGSPGTFSSYIIKHYKKGGEEEDAPCDFSCASFVGWTTRRADDNWRVGEHEEGKEEEEGGDDTDGEARQLACVITGAACLATVFHDIPADHVQSTTPGVFRVRISMTLSLGEYIWSVAFMEPDESWSPLEGLCSSAAITHTL